MSIFLSSDLSSPKIQQSPPSSVAIETPRRRFHLLALLLLVLFAVSLTGGCAHRNREMYKPAPITVAQQSVAQRETTVKALIAEALRDYGWFVDKESPGMIIARQSRSRHSARVTINYTQSEVRISYLNSDNLLFRTDSQGADRIHTRYNTWVRNLERQIAALVEY